ncbi:MAG: iron-sulfur cluster assembly accessory protein [Gammaproteobacteria bacterium]|nr:MAG: iron-sulfur cluster assembly accessory protein [Gammaproteobacteria bacterium]
MSVQQFVPHIGLKMTPQAIDHTRRQLSKNDQALGLRISLKASGCSGYKYVTSLVMQKEDGDEVLHIAQGIDVYINQKDLPILNGIEIDYVSKGLNKMLVFNNPNATGECGCGESFSVN